MVKRLGGDLENSVHANHTIVRGMTEDDFIDDDDGREGMIRMRRRIDSQRR